MIKNQRDLLKYLNGGTVTNIEGAKRNVYKYTDCGAWIDFKPAGIQIGSIVEGCEFGTAIYALDYPFSEADYNERMKAIEAEASAIWDWQNVTYDRTGRRNPNGKTLAEWGVDAPCIGPEYEHLNPVGRSS